MIGRGGVTAQDIARTIMWAATALSTDVTNGGYYTPPGIIGQVSEAGRNDALGPELWAWTQSIVTGLPCEEPHIME